MLEDEPIIRIRLKRLSAALQECADELKVAEKRFAATGQDSAAARMNVAHRAAKTAIREHGLTE